MISLDFATAGNAVFTVEPPTGFVESVGCRPHYTYKIVAKAFDNGRTFHFVGLLTGPENTSDYQYLGSLVAETGEVRLTAKSAFGEDSWPVKIIRRVMARLAAGEGDLISHAGWKVHHEGRCGRCGRVLTVPSSVESGIGPECATRGMKVRKVAPRNLMAG